MLIPVNTQRLLQIPANALRLHSAETRYEHILTTLAANELWTLRLFSQRGRSKTELLTQALQALRAPACRDKIP